MTRTALPMLLLLSCADAFRAPSADEKEAKTAAQPGWYPAQEMDAPASAAPAPTGMAVGGEGGRARVDRAGLFGEEQAQDGAEGLKDKAAHEGPGAAPTRSWFPESFLWAPEVITDKNGVATVAVKVPDSLTTWRVLGLAWTAAGAQAGGATTVLSTLPAYVDVAVPLTLEAGDSLDLPVQVVNTTTGNLREPLTVEVSGAAGGGSGVLEAPAGGTATRVVQVATSAPGPVEVSASFGGVDRVERSFLVRPGGEAKTERGAGAVGGPASAVPAGGALPGGELVATVWSGASSVIREELGGGPRPYEMSPRSPAIRSRRRRTSSRSRSKRASSPPRMPTPRGCGSYASAPGSPSRGLVAPPTPPPPASSPRRSASRRRAPSKATSPSACRIRCAPPRRPMAPGSSAPPPSTARSPPPLPAPVRPARTTACASAWRAPSRARWPASRSRSSPSGRSPRGASPIPSWPRASATPCTAPSRAMPTGRTSLGAARSTRMGAAWGMRRPWPLPRWRWGSGRASLLALRALHAVFGDSPSTGAVELRVGGQAVATGNVVLGAHAPVLLRAPWSGSATMVEVHTSGAAPGLVYSWAATSYQPWRAAASAVAELTVRVPQRLRVSETAMLGVAAGTPSTVRASVVLGLPAGVRPDPAGMDSLRDGGAFGSWESSEGALVLRDLPAGGWEGTVPVVPGFGGQLSSGSSALFVGGGESPEARTLPARWAIAGL